MVEQDRMTERDHWLDQLSNFVIVDMGIISSPSLTMGGYRCRVKPFRLYSGQQIVYENVEILLPGNKAVGIDIDLDGTACLIFGPYSSSVSIENRTLAGMNSPYDQRYLKCMPIGNSATWMSRLRFSNIGECSYLTPTSSFSFRIDGSVSYNQESPQQAITCDSSGIIRQTTPNITSEYRPDGSYMRCTWGVEPGSISKLESFLDNIIDTFYMSTEVFEEKDGEETLWEQLLTFEKWFRHEQHDITSGIKFVELYDANGNVLSYEEWNPDGSRLLINTDADGVNLFSRLIESDGAVTLEIGDAKYTLSIAADGTVTESADKDRSIGSNGSTVITSVGDLSVSSDANVTLESTANGLLTIGNTVNTLGKFLDTIYTQLTSLHTEGSPAAHTASAWAASWIPAEQAKLAQVFD
jgi:hypothetical protein